VTLANDSILVTPGSGATVATHNVGSKEHQVMMCADSFGHIEGAKQVYFARIPTQVHVAVANTVHWDLWNGDASLIVRVLSILQIPSITIAVTGVAVDWKLARTTSIGLLGTAITPWLQNTGDTALDADITCRAKPTSGAAEGTILRDYALHSEETNAATIQIASQGGLELVPQAVNASSAQGRGIILQPGSGLRCVQVTSSLAGNTGWLIGFTVE
jgi:hypothetical protein